MNIKPLTLLLAILCVGASGLPAKDLTIPDQPPAPPELAGRWMEKMAEHKGNYTRYCIYVFTRKSEFTAFYAAYDAKKKTWVEAEKVFKGGKMDWKGYVQSDGPDALVLHALPGIIFPMVLPFPTKYHLAGDVMTLCPSLGTMQTKTPATLKRVQRFPKNVESEDENERALMDKRIAEGIFDDGFRKWFLMGMREASGHATDEEMIRNFHEHRADFEQLLAMVREDKGVKEFPYDEDATDNKMPAGLTPERFEQYRALYKTLDLQRGVAGFGESKEISFIASSRGMLNSGSRKFYEWLSEPPPKEKIVASIDDYVEKYHAKRRAYFDQHGHGAPNEYFTIYRPIEGNWWLQYSD